MKRLVQIQLTQDAPVDPKHGMTMGRVLRAFRIKNLVGEIRLWSVVGDTGERVIITSNEARQIEEE